MTERQDYDDGEDLYEVRYTDKTYNYYDKTDPPPRPCFTAVAATIVPARRR